jgi:hypothetical protein
LAGALSIALGTFLWADRAGGESRLPPGRTWGGTGIRLEVTPAGGRVEYDCAHGTIDQPLVFDRRGRFDVSGMHFPEHGGPVREGEEAKGQSVRYTGRVTADTMRLTVKLPDGRVLGPYTLVRGRSGRIRKCL